ncbi:hypothetical protein XENTR_v10003745 [Xenopus tropicalis]|nr:hypothetical protein XENTR_v10003745 [Xenopus tropicalis]
MQRLRERACPHIPPADFLQSPVSGKLLEGTDASILPLHSSHDSFLISIHSTTPLLPPPKLSPSLLAPPTAITIRGWAFHSIMVAFVPLVSLHSPGFCTYPRHSGRHANAPQNFNSD